MTQILLLTTIRAEAAQHTSLDISCVAVYKSRWLFTTRQDTVAYFTAPRQSDLSKYLVTMHLITFVLSTIAVTAAASPALVRRVPYCLLLTEPKCCPSDGLIEHCISCKWLGLHAGCHVNRRKLIIHGIDPDGEPTKEQIIDYCEGQNLIAQCCAGVVCTSVINPGT
jgi:hypothetical protein